VFCQNEEGSAIRSLMTASTAHAGCWPKCIPSEGEGVRADGPQG